MSKVIQVLAQMGSDSSLQTKKAIETLLASVDIDNEQSEAIITKNVTSLERQLDICPDFYCAVMPAEDKDKDKDDEDEDETQKAING